MRVSALGLAIALAGTVMAPPGRTRFAAYVAFPCLLVLYLWARGRARPDEDFKDTPWGL
jgi:hypothetical protein